MKLDRPQANEMMQTDPQMVGERDGFLLGLPPSMKCLMG